MDNTRYSRRPGGQKTNMNLYKGPTLVNNSFGEKDGARNDFAMEEVSGVLKQWTFSQKKNSFGERLCLR